jgi:hypothetical protein
MTFDIANLTDSIKRMQDLHALHEATGSCLECHNPWPCDTDSYLTRATNALRGDENRRQLNPALELGKVLAAVEARLSLENPRAERVISKLHHLVLENGVEVTGRMDWVSEYQVGVNVGRDSCQRLWHLTLGSMLSIKIFAATGNQTSQSFLSQVLMDTFSPRDAEELVAWWENNDESCLRTITLHYDDPTSITKTLLMLIEATTRFNNYRQLKQP